MVSLYPSLVPVTEDVYVMDKEAKLLLSKIGLLYLSMGLIFGGANIQRIMMD